MVCLAAVALVTACGKGSDDSLQREQQQYDVVQEGTSTAASSTIGAPGEVPPPAMTNTNADTTSNFTLPQVATTTTTQPPGTIASTITIPSSSGPLIGYPAAPPRPSPTGPADHPAATTSRTDTTATTSTSLEPPPSTSTNPPTTDTAPPPPPSTDTQPPPTTTTGLGPQASDTAAQS